MTSPTGAPGSQSSLSTVPSNVTEYGQMLYEVQLRLQGYTSTSTGVTDHTVTLLSAFMECLPKDGVANIAEDILNSNDDEGLRALAQHLLTAVLIPMKAHPVTPVVTPSPRFGAHDSVEEISSEIESASRAEQAWLKSACLKRDGNKCVITGFYDTNEWNALGVTERPDAITFPTELAHIIPFSMGSFSEGQRWNTATVWDGLYRCFPSIRSRLNLSADTINMVANAMTMVDTLHGEFGKFSIALRPTNTDNVYRLIQYPKCSNYWRTREPLSQTITLTTHDPQYALPSRILLETHAAIAKIMHMTGMGEIIDKALEDRKAIRCLAEDGTTNVQSLMLVF